MITVGRLEKVLYPIISLTVVVLFRLMGVNTDDISNLDNVLLGAITLNSIGVAFLIASVAMLPAFANNSFFQKLRELKTEQKLLQLLGGTIKLLLVLSILAVVMLLTKDIVKVKCFYQVLFYVWLCLLSYSFLVIYSVVKIFLKVINSIQKNS